MLAHSIRNLLFICSVAASFGAVLGCGSTQKTPAEKEDKKEKKPKKERKEEKNAVSEKGKSWGGWRWKGDRDDCFYVHDNQCYAKEKAACKAADCGKGKCVVRKGAPSKVTCKKKDKK